MVWVLVMAVISRESAFIRHSITDGLRIAGGLYLFRQKYTHRDFVDGNIGHCPYCYDELLKQVKNSRCKYCYGTGMADGGYKPVGVIRAHLTENTRDYQNKMENAGIREQQDMTMKLPFEPQFNSGDVFAEIIEMSDGIPLTIGRIFQINGDVTFKTIQGVVSGNVVDMEMDLNKRLVSQEAQVKLLFETDDKYLLSDDFWGIDSVRNPDTHEYEPDNIANMTEVDRYHSSAWSV